MTTPTTIDLDTELSAVNSILGSIGQSPVTTLGANLETQAETELTGNGSNQTFAIGYSYDSPAQLSVTVNGVAATDYVVSSGNIVFTTAPANQAKVLITKRVETYNTLANPEVAFILQLLKETNIEVQSEGWVYNSESHVEFSPTNNKIPIPSNVLRLDVFEDEIYRSNDVVKRGNYLYDKVKHTDVFTNKVVCDVVYLWPFEDLPQAFKRYIVQKASVRAATQLVSNPALVQLLQQQEAYTRAICMEYECNQGDHNYLGFGHDQGYRSYKPSYGLRR